MDGDGGAAASGDRGCAELAQSLDQPSPGRVVLWLCACLAAFRRLLATSSRWTSGRRSARAASRLGLTAALSQVASSVGPLRLGCFEGRADSIDSSQIIPYCSTVSRMSRSNHSIWFEGEQNLQCSNHSILLEGEQDLQCSNHSIWLEGDQNLQCSTYSMCEKVSSSLSFHLKKLESLVVGLQVSMRVWCLIRRRSACHI